MNLLPRPEVVPPKELLGNAAIIWGINVVTFALWYWVLDGGGPRMRHERSYKAKYFLFPQQQRDEKEHWCPSSTAFSPTDTLILSQRPKVLVMIQALLSLVAVAVLAARAINMFDVVASAT